MTLEQVSGEQSESPLYFVFLIPLAASLFAQGGEGFRNDARARTSNYGLTWLGTILGLTSARSTGRGRARAKYMHQERDDHCSLKWLPVCRVSKVRRAKRV